MPIREFICPKHGTFEKIFTGQFDQTYTACPARYTYQDPFSYGEPCNLVSPLVEYSVPAKRDSKYGEG